MLMAISERGFRLYSFTYILDHNWDPDSSVWWLSSLIFPFSRVWQSHFGSEPKKRQRLQRSMEPSSCERTAWKSRTKRRNSLLETTRYNIWVLRQWRFLLDNVCSRIIYDIQLKKQYARFRGNPTNGPPALCPSHQTMCFFGRRVFTLLLHTTQSCITVKYFLQNIAFTDNCN